MDSGVPKNGNREDSDMLFDEPSMAVGTTLSPALVPNGKEVGTNGERERAL